MKIIGIFIFIISSVGLFGQKQQFDRATYYTFGVNLFAESHTLPSESKDSVEVLVLFKVVYEALIFVQMNPLDNPGSFQALPSVEIFFRDASGIIKNRTLWSDSVWVNTYNETKAKDKYVEGYIITKLPLSEFKCTVQLLDRYKNIADKTEITINTKKNFIENEIISEPIFCYSTSSLPAYKSIPYILGNKINFTSKDSKLLIPVSFKKNYDVYNYVITKNIDKNDQFWNDPINISGRVQPSENTYLNLEKNNKNEIEISLKSGFNYPGNHNPYINVGILNIELPSAQLSPGTYNLVIYNDGQNDTSKFEFEVVWVDMPLALRNPQYALEMMYYILTDYEYNSLKSLSDENKVNKIMDYWKMKDPTKSTPYNEAMTEYFKRVDYAFFNYQTLKEKDGAKSERGKIYILYGNPDSVEKKLIDGIQFEIWTYSKLNKTFYFELVSNGLFILTKIDE